MVDQERPVVDGFLNSASQLYLPTSYRASALSQMEVLRRAKGYRTRWFISPVDLDEPIPAFSQLEYQVQVQPGSYVWGIGFSAPFAEAELVSSSIRVQVTDACTETPFFSDYTKGVQFEPVSTHPNFARYPTLIMPRIVGEPGLLDVELYNSLSVSVRCQLVLFVAEPIVPPGDILDALIQSGLVRRGRG
jgi:hypothetical protein